MKSFTNEELSRDIKLVLSNIQMLEDKADALVQQLIVTTRFLTDEDREALVNYFIDQIISGGSESDDAIARLVDTSHYRVGMGSWTDRALMEEFAARFGHDPARMQEEPLWREDLSQNLAAVSVVGDMLQEKANEEV